MELTRKLLASDSVTLADQRQVTVICSTGEPDRMGDVIVQSGIDLTAYKLNPIVLWGHSADVPIARAIDISVKGGKLQATVQFPPEGDDEDSDWVYGKIKAGIVNATSVGFIPKDYQPLDPKEPWSGYKFLKSELLEFSFVSVPANSGCLIVGRSLVGGVDVPLLPSLARANGGTGSDEAIAQEPNDPRVPKVVAALFKGDLAEAFRLAKTPRAIRQKYLEPAAEVVAEVVAVEAKAADGAAVVVEEIIAPVEKSGRKISAATEASIRTTMGHCESAIKCMKDMLDSNATADDPDDDGDGNSVIALAVEPTVVVDPRALRLAEAKALRASAKL